MTSSHRSKGKDDDTEDEMPTKASSSSNQSQSTSSSHSQRHRSGVHESQSPSVSRKTLGNAHSEAVHAKHNQHASHGPHGHGMHSGLNGLWMLIDGIGLAIITTATILEGYELWWEIFQSHWDTNVFSEMLWFTGRSLQVMGLFFLIGHAASFQIFPQVEQFGMLLLTAGPIVNMTACYTFHHQADNLFNRRWMSSETLELIGIVILDVSLIDMEEYLVLSAEMIGFFFLCCAAMLNFEYFPQMWIPDIGIRLDMVHSSECFGLMMLMIVAYAQYRIKCAKHEASMNNSNSSHPHSKQPFIV